MGIPVYKVYAGQFFCKHPHFVGQVCEGQRERDKKTCVRVQVYIQYIHTQIENNLDIYVCMQPACNLISRETEPALCDNRR